MAKITFEITEKEVRRVARQKLDRATVKKVLEMVENDIVLWDDIEKSIQDSIKQTLL